VAQQLGKSRSACIREAINQYMLRHGDPRPAVVVQADGWLQAHPSLTLCPLTSTLMRAPLVRIAVEPSPRNGLRKPSQLMVDKLFTVPVQAVGNVLGQLEPQALIELDLALRGWRELP
jgi:mRNA interferase MazF